MARLTITIDPVLFQRLRQLAVERRVPFDALVREALEEKVAGQRPKPRSLGIADSGFSDTSRLAGEERPEPRSWR